MPNPPEGKLYLHDATRAKALCTNFNTGVPCAALPISQTNKFFMLAPEDFESLNNYIDELIRRLESYATPMAVGHEPAIPVYKSDLKKTKSLLKRRQNQLYRQL